MTSPPTPLLFVTPVVPAETGNGLAMRCGMFLAALGAPQRPAVRVGISGVPGVGKSTFIEALGTRLTDAGHRVGVLAVDPSSGRTGGSVLGDKTRMPRLAADERAFIRASPSAGTLGGVARATNQAMLVLEASGYDVVLVETVGVGQSEITVAGMVDTFLFLTLARTGDQLQGIKKGILEIADVIAVNKADGDRAIEAASAARELAGALRLVYAGGDAWVPPVLTCSALRRAYRDQLRAAAPGLRFVFIDIAPALARERVAARSAHFFNTALVDSQFATLESPVGEPGVLRVDAAEPLPQLLDQVAAWAAAPSVPQTPEAA